MKKTCSGCKKKLELNCFHKKKSNKDGLKIKCKTCRIKSSKKYYQKNKKRISKWNKEYRKKNIEKISKAQKIWGEKNRKKIAKKSKEYREKNKEEIKLKKEKYYQNNKERINEYGKEYRKKNREKYLEGHRIYRKNNKKSISEIKKKWYQRNKERVLKRIKDNRKKNPKKKKESDKKWYEKNKNTPEFRLKRSKRKNERKKTDLNFRLKENLRTRLYNALKGISKSVETMELMGCTIEKFKQHLESQFTVGMTWKNYGIKGWHMDHIVPCAEFDLTQPEQQRECFNYKNLQPLWWYDNLSKYSKLNWSKNEKKDK